jgi:hypothetical protein
VFSARCPVPIPIDTQLQLLRPMTTGNATFSAHVLRFYSILAVDLKLFQRFIASFIGRILTLSANPRLQPARDGMIRCLEADALVNMAQGHRSLNAASKMDLARERFSMMNVAFCRLMGIKAFREDFT